MKKWENFSKEDLSKIVKESCSYSQIAEKIGYSKQGGSNILAVKEMINYYDFDISHLKGQSSSKNTFDYSRFRKGNVIKIVSALPALVNLRGHKCECCENSEWNNCPIPLEVHHKDGDKLNNELDNLELLCPNCHAQTENWRGKNSFKKKEISEEQFVKALKSKPNIRQALLSLGLTAKGGNYSRARELIHKYNITHLL